jgi:peptide/nickel transport system ATP-binding protein
MTPLVSVANASKLFRQSPTLGERLAALAGGSLPRPVHAVDSVSLDIRKGEVLGLVGESGCGKSTLGRMIAGILQPSTGHAHLDGVPLLAETGRPVKTTTRVQMVFQDPFASLDPRMRVGDIVSEGPVANGIVPAAEIRADTARWLSTVGLDPAVAERYPHQFSGGQRQRIAIARALAMRPDVLVCDEPVASLDVSIQAQIITLIKRLCREHGTAVMLVTHDMGVIAETADRVAVMYAGRIAEIGPVRDVIQRARHPYTEGLMGSIPKLGNQQARLAQIDGAMPRLTAIPKGCAFNPRCAKVFDRCRAERPEPIPVGDSRVACWLYDGQSKAAAQ